MKRVLSVLALLVSASGTHWHQCYFTERDSTSPTGNRDIVRECSTTHPSNTELYCLTPYYPSQSRRGCSDSGEVFENHVYYGHNTTVSCVTTDRMWFALGCTEHLGVLPREGCMTVEGKDYVLCFCKGDACDDHKSVEAIYSRGAKYVYKGGCDQIRNTRSSTVTEKRRKCWSTRADVRSPINVRDVVRECDSGNFCGSLVEKESEEKVPHVLTDREEGRSHVLHYTGQCFNEERIRDTLRCVPEEGCFEVSPTSYFCFCNKQACNSISRLEDLASNKVFRKDGSCTTERGFKPEFSTSSWSEWTVWRTTTTMPSTITMPPSCAGFVAPDYTPSLIIPNTVYEFDTLGRNNAKPSESCRCSDNAYTKYFFRSTLNTDFDEILRRNEHALKLTCGNVLQDICVCSVNGLCYYSEKGAYPVLVPYCVKGQCNIFMVVYPLRADLAVFKKVNGTSGDREYHAKLQLNANQTISIETNPNVYLKVKSVACGKCVIVDC